MNGIKITQAVSAEIPPFETFLILMLKFTNIVSLSSSMDEGYLKKKKKNLFI